MPDSDEEAQAIHTQKVLAMMFLMAAKMRHLGLEDDVSVHRVYYYLKLAEHLLLQGELHVVQSFLDATDSAGDFEDEGVMAEVARMEEFLRLRFDDLDGYEQWLFPHFRLHCLAETERDCESFGVIFGHLELWYQQPRGRLGLRGRDVLRGGEGGESEHPTDDESDNDDGADCGCEGSGPEGDPEESRARSRRASNAFLDRRGREGNLESENPHETENIDVQRVMDESSRSL